MDQILGTLNRFLTGPIMVWSVLAVGVYLTFCTGGVQFRYFGRMLRETLGRLFSRSKSKRGGITPFQAMTAALSGTLGTGNIAGVAAAVSVGGAGALFWMWMSALFGMATKYTEIVLAVAYRKKMPDGQYRGGPMCYLPAAFCRTPKLGQKMAAFFSVCCLGASFFMGNMVQSNTAAAALSAVFPIPSSGLKICFAVITLLVGVVIFGGLKRITRTTEWLIPLLSLIYMAGCVFVIVRNAEGLPAVWQEIWESAFSVPSAAGGVGGFLLNRSVKVGITRGIFTNEAGLGSAPIVHASAETPSPAHQGLWGMFEVFLDTIVFCSLTGFVVLLSGFHREGIRDGAALTLRAFEQSLGSGAAVLIGGSTVFFALATILGWNYYGETCVRTLFPKREDWAVSCYRVCYMLAVYLGAVTALDLVWGLSDLFNGLMMLPNLCGILLLSGKVRKENRALSKK